MTGCGVVKNTGGTIPKLVVVESDFSVVEIDASVPGKVITVEGGITLCCGVMVAVFASSEPTVMGQNSMFVVVTGGMVITVVFVLILPCWYSESAFSYKLESGRYVPLKKTEQRS